MRGASPSDTCASAQLVYIVCTFICIPYWDASIMEQIAIIGHCNEYYFEDEWLPVAWLALVSYSIVPRLAGGEMSWKFN